MVIVRRKLSAPGDAGIASGAGGDDGSAMPLPAIAFLYADAAASSAVFGVLSTIRAGLPNLDATSVPPWDVGLVAATPGWFYDGQCWRRADL